VWVVIPYQAVTLNGSTCDMGQHPNGPPEDATFNALLHEDGEIRADPHLDAWFADPGTQENGDKCESSAEDNGVLGDDAVPLGGANGYEWTDQLPNGFRYYSQQLYSNAVSDCAGPGTS